MQVILMEQIQGVGQMGDVTNVANGYARNFLLPRGKALLANKSNMAKFEAQKAEMAKTQAAAKADAEKAAEKLAGVSIKLNRQASEVGALYGSIKARDIEASLLEKGHTVARQNIQIGTPIKEVGDHSVQLFLHPEVVHDLPVTVERQSL